MPIDVLKFVRFHKYLQSVQSCRRIEIYIYFNIQYILVPYDGPKRRKHVAFIDDIIKLLL
jgi:hypothetical protein